MIKTNEIKGLMAKEGITMGEMAKKMDMTPKTLGLRMKKGEFNNFEIEKMITILNIENPMDIFFAEYGT